MKPHSLTSVFALALVFGAFGVACGSSSETNGDKATGTQAPTGGVAENPNNPPPQPPPPSTPAPVQQETAPLGNKPPIEARAKAELDGKEPDANWSGNAMAVPGGRATFTVPTAWASSNATDGTRVAAAADGKAKLGAGTASTGVDAASRALGLTECTWNPPDNITLGKDKLAAAAADGVCLQGGKPARAVQVVLANEGVAGVGAWDPSGGDSNSVFASLRAAKKAAAGTGVGGDLGACCAALAQNAQSAPLEQKGYYLAAVGVCNSMKGSSDARAALGAISAALKGAGMPPICR